MLFSGRGQPERWTPRSQEEGVDLGAFTLNTFSNGGGSLRYEESIRRPAPCTRRWGREPFAELWYVFDHLDRRLGAGPRQIGVGEEMSSYWVNLRSRAIRYGQGLPQWQAFAKTDEQSNNGRSDNCGAGRISKGLACASMLSTQRCEVTFDCR